MDRQPSHPIHDHAGLIGESLGARVHEAATKAREQPAVMEVTPEEAERIQVHSCLRHTSCI